MRACALFDPGFSNRNSPFLIRQTFTTLTMWLERASSLNVKASARMQPSQQPIQE